MILKEIYKLELEKVLLLAEMSKYKFWTKEYKDFIPAYNILALEIQYKKGQLTSVQLNKYLK